LLPIMKILSRLLFTATLFLSINSFAQQQPVNMQYAVSMEKAADHLYHVELTNKTLGKTLDFKMCAWTPGYYQLIDFAAAVQNFKVTGNEGVNLKWQKVSENTWRVYHDRPGTVKISYDVKATVP